MWLRSGHLRVCRFMCFLVINVMGQHGVVETAAGGEEGGGDVLEVAFAFGCFAALFASMFSALDGRGILFRRTLRWLVVLSLLLLGLGLGLLLLMLRS